jgi:hypothetical protein
MQRERERERERESELLYDWRFTVLATSPLRPTIIDLFSSEPEAQQGESITYCRVSEC